MYCLLLSTALRASAQEAPLPDQTGAGATVAPSPGPGSQTPGAQTPVTPSPATAPPATPSPLTPAPAAPPAPIIVPPTAVARPTAALHTLATHDATYWGLPALAGLLGFLAGTAIHMNVAAREAKLWPRHRDDIVTLWGWSGLVLALSVGAVGALFSYWGLSSTQTAQIFSKHLPDPYIWLLVAFVVPVAIWVVMSWGRPATPQR